MRRGEKTFTCPKHGYECRAWNQTVCAMPGRVAGCELCAEVFGRALNAIGYGDEYIVARSMPVRRLRGLS